MATTPPNLIVLMAFNPPTITLIGGIKEKTVSHLDEVLPSACTTSKEGRRSTPKFQRKTQKTSDAEFWHVDLPGQYCDQVGVSSLFCVLFDALEQEGNWILKDTNAVTMEKESYKFFFVKRL